MKSQIAFRGHLMAVMADLIRKSGSGDHPPCAIVRHHGGGPSAIPDASCSNQTLCASLAAINAAIRPLAVQDSLAIPAAAPDDRLARLTAPRHGEGSVVHAGMKEEDSAALAWACASARPRYGAI